MTKLFKCIDLCACLLPCSSSSMFYLIFMIFASLSQPFAFPYPQIFSSYCLFSPAPLSLSPASHYDHHLLPCPPLAEYHSFCPLLSLPYFISSHYSRSSRSLPFLPTFLPSSPVLLYMSLSSPPFSLILSFFPLSLTSFVFSFTIRFS